jgi:hypothetical protein
MGVVLLAFVSLSKSLRLLFAVLKTDGQQAY